MAPGFKPGGLAGGVDRGGEEGGAMIINYDYIKQAAKEDGCRIDELLALARTNDPFYQAPAQVEAAEWFVARWKELGYTSGVHVRRMHYALSSMSPPPKRPDGSTYENNLTCWKWLDTASLAARYLGLISSENFIDRRNPNPAIHEVKSYEPDPEPRIEWWDEWWKYQLPAVPRLPDLPGRLPDLPNYAATDLPSVCEQPVLIEVWCEKTTMNDVLAPICRKYHVNFVTGAGELSETACYRFLQRVMNAGKPARIFYVSDFDPAGLGMPVSVARKIEFWRRNKPEFADLDIRLDPIILTREQVDEYDLPRIPVKDSDMRKGRFEEVHGEGQVELDALEALHPGELGRIVTGAILQYRDLELPDRVQEAYDEYEAYLAEVTDSIQSVYADRQEELEAEYRSFRGEWQAIRDRFEELTASFHEEVEALNARAEDIRSRARTLHDEALGQCRDQIQELDSFERPEAELPEEPDGQLYDSGRDYFEQIEVYQQYRAGEERGVAA